MIYSTIDNKALKDHNFESLRKFFQEEVFFKFMDQGRAGFKSTVEDMVDCFAANLAARIIDVKVKELPADVRFRCNDLACASMIDHFITRGMGGVITAIHDCHQIVYSAMRGEEL